MSPLTVPLWTILRSRDEFGGIDLPLLTVKSESGVGLRDLAEGRQPSEDLATYRQVEKGDLVVNKLWARFGAYGVSDHRGVISPAYWVMATDRRRALPRYLHYLLRSAPYVHEVGRVSKNQPPNGYDLPWDQFRKILVTFPPMEEQRRIANFLDAETSRIDALRLKREELRGLLLERKQAAVDSVMDSAPCQNHKLSRSLDLVRDGTHQPPPRVDTGVPLLTARNVSSGKLVLTESDTFVSFADADDLDRSLKIRPRDVLLSVKGTIGACALVPYGFPRVVLDRNVAALRPNRSTTGEWLMWAIRSSRVQDQMRLAMGFSAQPGLPLGDIKELKVPMPEIDVQRVLVQQVERAAGLIDRTMARVRQAQCLLTERRQALITAAVTGQLDVTTARSGVRV